MLHVLVEVLPRDLHHPARNSGRKHYVLRLARRAPHVVENLFHVVLEALLEHRVGLVDADHL